jgi:site-specific DNA recombinase
LSRSLLDFAKLMAVFEQHHVAFVSVTQQLNSATSMGRLVSPKEVAGFWTASL